MNAPVTLQQIADYLGGTLRGEGDLAIAGVAPLQPGVAGKLSFLSHPRLRPQLTTTRATAVIIGKDDLPFVPDTVATIVVLHPYLAYAQVSSLFAPAVRQVVSSEMIDCSAQIASDAVIALTAVIAADTVIGAGVVIEDYCVIGAHCRIGSGSHLYARVTLYDDVTIGERAIIHSGAVLGADGFGFANDAGRWVKIHQLGGVVIGDDVEIGANTTIDRGAMENTLIGHGVKLDNQIQVAHNVKIGDHTAIAGCVGIAGSAKIGAHCAIGGGAGILGHLTIADGVTVTAMSLVTQSIEQPGIYSTALPLESKRSAQRNAVRYTQLDAMARRLSALERTLQSPAPLSPSPSSNNHSVNHQERRPVSEESEPASSQTTAIPSPINHSMDIQEILNYLPHRFPFLLVDRVLSCEPGVKLTALKNITVNEPFFPGHFPGRPIFPGVLIMEALAQATGILAFKSSGARPAHDKLYFFAGIDNCRFKQPVIPGDQLLLEVAVVKEKRGIWKFTGVASVAGKVVASADLMCAEQRVQ
ncbi:MAG: UDP-3-O-(3-hydroxymyristoyl)glucosamine N-acyltransferase [Gammaproteobacteria bacterium]|nr:UDP-3-O-(3-hydroxymyristoyl)glucosamine N-acyltransferase [Gammaproteobacteria bacterium]